MITTPPTPGRLGGTSLLVGIDDTDTLDSPGTGRLARLLVDELAELGVARAVGATRHQLLVDPRIPYTSHNSSVAIALVAAADPVDPGAVIEAATAFLERIPPAGSDPGLAIVTASTWERPQARERLAEFGRLAQRDVLDQATAQTLAAELGVHLSAHGGDGGGIIGALAGVGLHLSGDDGRFLWMPGLRALAGALTYAELLAAVPIDAALDPDGREPADDEVIELGEWIRPILRGGRAVLLLDGPAGAPQRWSAAGRDVVKSY